MAALFMARQQASLNGVLRVAGAFSTLGDHETVERCIATAERLAAAAPAPEGRDRPTELFPARAAAASNAGGDLL